MTSTTHNPHSTTTAESVAPGGRPDERTVDQDGVREHAIREAAYRRFQARDGAPGDERQDWLDAQAEIDGQPS